MQQVRQYGKAPHETNISLMKRAVLSLIWPSRFGFEPIDLVVLSEQLSVEICLWYRHLSYETAFGTRGSSWRSLSCLLASLHLHHQVKHSDLDSEMDSNLHLQVNRSNRVYRMDYLGYDFLLSSHWVTNNNTVSRPLPLLCWSSDFHNSPNGGE
jgi:hypothetical protein